MKTRLNINVQNSNLKINRTDPKVKIQGTNSSWNIKKKERKFDIKQKYDTVEINNYPPNKQLYRKNPTDLMQQNINYSQNEGAEGISQIVREGDRAMKLENNEKNTFSNIAEENSYARGKTDIKLDYFPKEPVEINVKKGYMDVEYSPSSIETTVKKNLKVDVEPGKLETGADRYPKVEINTYTVDTLGNNYDTKI